MTHESGSPVRLFRDRLRSTVTSDDPRRRDVRRNPRKVLIGTPLENPKGRIQFHQILRTSVLSQLLARVLTDVVARAPAGLVGLEKGALSGFHFPVDNMDQF